MWVHKVVYNSETIWDRDKANIDAPILMLIDDVYWFWDFKDEYFRRLGEIKFALKFRTKMAYKFQNWSPNLIDIVLYLNSIILL